IFKSTELCCLAVSQAITGRHIVTVKPEVTGRRVTGQAHQTADLNLRAPQPPPSDADLHLLRYSDLQRLGIVGSRTQLHRLIDQGLFPKGRLISANSRAWTGLRSWHRPRNA